MNQYVNVRKSVPSGMKLSNNDKVVNAVEKRLNEHTEGFCPCVADSIGNADFKCPCVKARVEKECCCGIYVSS